MVCSTDSYQVMLGHISRVAPAVLADASSYYRLADRPDGWHGFLVVTTTGATLEEPHFEQAVPFDGTEQGKYEVILRGKVSAMAEQGVETSIQVRRPPAEGLAVESVIWGGGSVTDQGEFDAGTRAPELCDHLLLHGAQCLAGRISKETYVRRTALDYPGIRDAIDFAKKDGLNAGSYLSMKASVEQMFAAGPAEGFNFYK